MAQSNRAAFVLLVLFLLSVLCAGLARAADVGEVVLVRNVVRGIPPGGSPAPLAVGHGVGLGLRVETGDDSAAKMTFDPHGALTLGSRANVLAAMGAGPPG